MALLLVLGVGVSLLWGLGVPALFAFLLWRNKQALLEDPHGEVRRQLGLLVEGYRPTAWKSELLAVAQRVGLVVILHVVPVDNDFLNVLAMLWMSNTLLVYLLFKPFASMLVRNEQMVALVLLLFLWLLKGTTSSSTPTTVVATVGLGAGLLGFVVVVTLTTVMRRRLQRRAIRNALEDYPMAPEFSRGMMGSGMADDEGLGNVLWDMVVAWEDMEIIREDLGRGGQGTVSLALWRGTNVVIKRFHRQTRATLCGRRGCICSCGTPTLCSFSASAGSRWPQ